MRVPFVPWLLLCTVSAALAQSGPGVIPRNVSLERIGHFPTTKGQLARHAALVQVTRREQAVDREDDRCLVELPHIELRELVRLDMAKLLLPRLYLHADVQRPVLFFDALQDRLRMYIRGRNESRNEADEQGDTQPLNQRQDHE